jgi:iron complex outermembrane receptor protein
LYGNVGFKQEGSAFSKLEYSLWKFIFYGDVQLRHTMFQYDGDAPMKDLDWTFLNPKGGVSLRSNERTIFYYSIGSTGREPTRTDMFMGNDDLPVDSLGVAIMGNTQPEYVTDHEVGFRITTEDLVLSLNGFHMDFTNEIVLDGKFGPNGLALTSNVERSTRSGVEFSYNYGGFGRFRLLGAFSFNHSRIKESDQVFSPILTPPVIAYQEVRYQIDPQLILGLSCRYQDGTYIDFANEVVIDGYYLFNAYAQYDFRRFRLSVYANNLSNIRYVNQGFVDFDGTPKYFVQAPLNFFASLSVTI